MADKTGIEWCTSTWNPIVGCSLVSPGCTNCYAMRQAARIVAMAEGSGKATHYAGTVREVKDAPVWTGEVHVAPDSIFLQPLKWRKPRRIFVNSMSDLFHEAVPDEVIDRVFAIMALTPQHTYQVLTKRPERMRAYVSDVDAAERIYDIVMDMAVGGAAQVILTGSWMQPPKLLQPSWPRVHLGLWPLANVWLGVSVEDQRRADERIPILLDTPAAIRWISAEPLLEALDLTPWLRRLHWIVAGGESGRNARPMHPDHPRSLRDQCEAAGIPYLFKQWGEFWPLRQALPSDLVDARQALIVSPSGAVTSGLMDYPPSAWIMHRVGKKAAGRLLDGVLWDQYPEVRT